MSAFKIFVKWQLSCAPQLARKSKLLYRFWLQESMDLCTSTTILFPQQNLEFRAFFPNFENKIVSAFYEFFPTNVTDQRRTINFGSGCYFIRKTSETAQILKWLAAVPLLSWRFWVLKFFLSPLHFVISELPSIEANLKSQNPVMTVQLKGTSTSGTPGGLQE